MAADANYAVLEWGPGGGANLSAIREIASVIYAVDISAKNLKESGRILTEAGFDAFRPVLLRDDMAAAVRQIETPIEVFLSTAVFQHFPTKEYGIQVLKEVFSVMTSGGCGLIQIRYDNGNPKYAPKPVEEYAQRHITATSYAIDEFWVLLQETGFEPFAIHGVDPRVNYATFTFTKP
jgi:cyclopropane fatty-acyl-phospholipid synthase-like methyltransferase